LGSLPVGVNNIFNDLRDWQQYVYFILHSIPIKASL
jgi:hypothetical protein